MSFAELIANTEMNWEEFLKEFNTPMPDIVPNDLSGKVVIVTGANIGIGYEAAKAIASMKPARLILACRNAERGNAAAKSIKEATNFENVEAWILDLASFASVQEFFKRFLDTGLPLDILLSNAGLGGMSNEWVESDDKYEITLQVNHLANVLLVSNLYPALKKSADLAKDLKHKFPRVEVVASDVHFWAAAPQPDDPHPVSSVLVKDAAPFRYFISKLFNVLFVKAWARKCPAPIWICSTNPSATQTQLGQKDPKTGDHKDVDIPAGFKLRPTYEGAKTIIHAAIAPEVGTNGAYYSNMVERSTTTGEVGVKFSDNVWNDTIAILKKHVPHSPIYDW